MFGGVSKEEYLKVVKANTELRLKLEKMRLENTLLRDQIRVVSALPPGESVLYVIIQSKASISLDGIRKEPTAASLSDADIKSGINKLINLGLVEITTKNGVDYYSVKTPDKTGGYVKVGEDLIRSPIDKPSNLLRNPDDI